MTINCHIYHQRTVITQINSLQKDMSSKNNKPLIDYVSIIKMKKKKILNLTAIEVNSVAKISSPMLNINNDSHCCPLRKN